MLLFYEMGRHWRHSNVYGSGDSLSTPVYYGPLKIKNKTLLALVKRPSLQAENKSSLI